MKLNGDCKQSKRIGPGLELILGLVRVLIVQTVDLIRPRVFYKYVVRVKIKEKIEMTKRGVLKNYRKMICPTGLSDHS